VALIAFMPIGLAAGLSPFWLPVLLIYWRIQTVKNWSPEVKAKKDAELAVSNARFWRFARSIRTGFWIPI
jgi:hypothetical protein